MTDIEQLQFLIDELENGVKSAFAKKCGFLKSQVSHFLDGSVKLSERTKAKIAEAYPEINKDWLLTGIGYPGNLSTKAVRAYYENVIREKDITIKNLSETIVNLSRK